jgi:hypothetical protein
MVWRLRADHGRKHEAGGDDNGTRLKAPRSLRRYEGRAHAARQTLWMCRRGLDDQGAITEEYDLEQILP